MTDMKCATPLSERIRPNEYEAAPWVIEAVKELETRLAFDKAKVAEQKRVIAELEAEIVRLNSVERLSEDEIKHADEHITELEAEIVRCHNPHTGNECDCDICEKAGPRGTR